MHVSVLDREQALKSLYEVSSSKNATVLFSQQQEQGQQIP